MRKEEFFFDSKDQESKIHALKWIPDEKPICIVQLVHGMAEYIERYEEFASFLAARGILVAGEDHLGHGKSIAENPPGYFCKKDPATVVVKDVYQLTEIIKKEYPDVLYIVMGHSMGSLITRNYITEYGKAIDGVIISATGMPDKTTMHLLSFLAAALSVFQGEKHPSIFLDKLGFGGYCKKITNPISKNAWLSVNEENVKRYDADPLCGFPFTINGFKTLKDLSLRLYDKKRLMQIPKELPVLFAYGEEDPVGEYGKAVKAVYESYKQLGIKDILIKQYDGDRHEILNELDRKKVMEDLYQWIISHIN